MKISARNQVPGKVRRVTAGKVSSEVVIEVGAGVALTAVITKASATALKLKKGQAVLAVIKATDVMVAVPCSRPDCGCTGP